MKSQIIQPMLACDAPPFDRIRFPVLASPKEDGIRCLKINGKALTRKFLPIPNLYIRKWIENNLPDGLDGELTIENKTFADTSGAIRKSTGSPKFTFHAFDYVISSLWIPYYARIKQLKNVIEFLDNRLLSAERFHFNSLLPSFIKDVDALRAFENEQLQKGKEGIVIRSIQSPYKCGRSTEKEGYLMRIVRFQTGEATIIGFEERQQNDNPQERDAHGKAKRSSHAENKHGRGDLGSLVVETKEGVRFNLGTGFDDKLRAELWATRKALPGKIIKYKSKLAGAKIKPRSPIFLGFRNAFDL